jgi:hypothetical protein
MNTYRNTVAKTHASNVFRYIYCRTVRLTCTFTWHGTRNSIVESKMLVLGHEITLVKL